MPDIDAESAARADYCRLLAACFYQPDPAFAEERMFEAMAGAGAELGEEFADDARALGAAFARDELQALLVDYTRLFLGPAEPVASPYEAAWVGRDGASPEVPVLALYADGDFAIAEDFMDLPDHVAAQLEFLYLTLFRQAEATTAGDLDALSKWETLQRRLLGDHVGRWVAPFAAALREGAQSTFYRCLGEATERFLAAERKRIQG